MWRCLCNACTKTAIWPSSPHSTSSRLSLDSTLGRGRARARERERGREGVGEEERTGGRVPHTAAALDSVSESRAGINRIKSLRDERGIYYTRARAPLALPDRALRVAIIACVSGGGRAALTRTSRSDSLSAFLFRSARRCPASSAGLHTRTLGRFPPCPPGAHSSDHYHSKTVKTATHNNDTDDRSRQEASREKQATIHSRKPATHPRVG